MNLQQFQRLLRRTVIFPIAALLLLVGVLGMQLRGTITALGNVERTDGLVADTQTLLRYIVDQETGLRGYQSTGDPVFLQPYAHAQAPIDELLRTLPARIVDPVLRGQTDELARGYRHWQRTFALPLASAPLGSPLFRNDAYSLAGKTDMDAIRALCDRMLVREGQLRVYRSTKARAQVRSTLLITLCMALVLGVLLAWNTHASLSSVSDAYSDSLNQTRAQAEESTRAARKLETTLHSIGDAVITCDAAGNVELMNPVAEQLCGWPRAEAFGRPLETVFRIVNEDTRQTVENPSPRSDGSTASSDSPTKPSSSPATARSTTSTTAALPSAMSRASWSASSSSSATSPARENPRRPSSRARSSPWPDASPPPSPMRSTIPWTPSPTCCISCARSPPNRKRITTSTSPSRSSRA